MARNDFEMPTALNQKMFADAKLYYDREDFLLNRRAINDYLEIGVLAGDYSDMVIRHLKPMRLDLLDPYDQPDWNSQTNRRFEKDSHYDYVKNKYASMSNVNIIKSGFHRDIPQIDNQYDYIYIDANHSREFMDDVMEFSKNHVVVGGLIGVNDYMIFDHFSDEYHGTVQSVNNFLITNPNWKVVAYVLGAALHPDIYLKRIS